MDNTLYVVSGFMRTGTSMMMHALETGGMDTAYRQSRDTMKNRFADDAYDPNIGGLYELAARDYRAWEFPRQWEGKLIKALNYAIPRMAPMEHGIRAVFLRRDAEEIRQSYMAFFGKQLQDTKTLDRRMDSVIERIRNRRDVLSLDVFWYRQVAAQPLPHFEQLVDHGWNFDPVKAAAVVDPDYCRYKVEELEIGVV